MTFCSFTCYGFTHSGSYLALIIGALEHPCVWECQQFECCLHTAHISHVYHSKTTQFIHGFKPVSHWTTPEKRELFVRTPYPCKIRLSVFLHTACYIVLQNIYKIHAVSFDYSTFVEHIVSSSTQKTKHWPPTLSHNTWIHIYLLIPEDMEKWLSPFMQKVGSENRQIQSRF